MNRKIINDYEMFLKVLYNENLTIYNKDEILNKLKNSFSVIIRYENEEDEIYDEDDTHYEVHRKTETIEDTRFKIYKDELGLFYEIHMKDFVFYIIQDYNSNKYKIQYENVIFDGFDENLFNFMFEELTN